MYKSVLHVCGEPGTQAGDVTIGRSVSSLGCVPTAFREPILSHVRH